MRSISFPATLRAVPLVTALLISQPSPCFSYDHVKRNRIEVTGEALIKKSADQVTLTASIITEARDAKEALGENSERISALIETLTSLKDASGGKFQTGSFSITPLYSTPPKSRPENWTAKIVGYRVRNSLDVTIEQVDKTGEWIDEITRAGADEIERISFALKNPGSHREEAIAEAIKNGIRSAEIASSAAGLSLGKIVKIDLQNAPSPQYHKEAFMLTAARSYSPTPIEPGDIDLSASARITFEIAEPASSTSE